LFRNKSEIDDLFNLYTSIPLHEAGESDIIYYQRSINKGRPEGDFSDFYKALDELLEEFGKAAEERRNSQSTHLPFAASVPQLIKKVLYYTN